MRATLAALAMLAAAALGRAEEAAEAAKPLLADATPESFVFFEGFQGETHVRAGARLRKGGKPFWIWCGGRLEKRQHGECVLNVALRRRPAL